jgi:hypothetical protein
VTGSSTEFTQVAPIVVPAYIQNINESEQYNKISEIQTDMFNGNEPTLKLVGYRNPSVEPS